MRKAISVELSHSNHSQSSKPSIVFLVFLFLYFILPKIIDFIPINLNLSSLILLMILPPLCVICLIRLIFGSYFFNFKNFLKLNYAKLLPSTIGWIFLAMIINILWVGTLISFSPLEYEEPAITAALQSDNITLTLTICILAIFIAPIAEELFFREILYNSLRQNIPETPCMILTSFIFAIAHAELWQIPGLFILGFMFQKQRNELKNLESAIAAHMLNNTLAVVLFFLMQECTY